MSTGLGSARQWTRGSGALLLLMVTVALGFGMRLVAQDASALHSSDSYHYLLLAEHLAAGEGFTSGGSEHPDLSRPPLYPMVLGAAMVLTGQVELAARLATALLGALAAVPLFFLARQTMGPGAALMTLPLAAFSCLIGGAVRLLPTSLSTLLALAALAMVLAAVRRGSLLLALLTGMLAGLTAMSRSEGVIWPPLLSFWLLVASAPVPRPFQKRLLAIGALVAGSLLVYTPYVAWSSARLERLDPMPPVTYMSQMRDLTDRLGLRWVDEGRVPWPQRAAGLLSVDHRHLVLQERFNHSRSIKPDLTEAAVEVADPPVGEEPAMTDILLRRLQIAGSNTSTLQRAIRYGHFAPAILLLLALAGLPTLLDHRRRQGSLFLLLALAGSLTPVLSHVERRFLYVAFALILIPAAAGWTTLARVAGRAAGPLARTATGVGLTLLVLWAGIAHFQGQRRPPEVMITQNKAAAMLASGPAGPVLAVQPAVPYRAGRMFRYLPVAAPEAVLEFARAQGATQILLEGDRDLYLRPDLAPLLESDSVPGFQLAHTMEDARGGRVFILHMQNEVPATPPSSGDSS